MSKIFNNLKFRGHFFKRVCLVGVCCSVLQYVVVIYSDV